MGGGSEFELIAKLVERLPAPGEGVRIGSGDDAAVTEPRSQAAATTVDAFVEGVHFMLPEFPLRAVGRKALAAALSDLAAMGAEPGEAYVVLGVPRRLDADALREVALGIAEVAEREGASVVGGDLTRAPVLALALTAVGYEPPGGRLVARAGARPGDVLAVTGELGGAAAALQLLREGGSSQAGRAGETGEAIRARQLDPRPRIAGGLALAAAGATAMIDVSDGLGADALHLARAGRVHLEIELERLPVQAGVAEVAGGEAEARRLAAEGGEDYELLVSLPPDRLRAAAEGVGGSDLRLTEIGSVQEGSGVTLRGPGGHSIEPRGFDHLRD